MFQEQYQQALEFLRQAVNQVYGERLVSLAVFGSVARGRPRPDSDIDIFLVAENLPRGRIPRMEEFSAVEDVFAKLSGRLKDIQPELSPIIKEKSEVLQGSWLFLDMVDDAQILYDRGGFLRRHLEKLRAKLEQLGARKIYRAGAWHWVLKKDYRPGDVIEL
ncbi:MAG: nucleotidyltransferase family protein [Desulfurispora sp.]|uniref:nucleotidyltransferase family protein n=1 Tax=Desulfurispora sp. TaxID=3014275 RepID=UPI00404B654B